MTPKPVNKGEKGTKSFNDQLKVWVKQEGMEAAAPKRGAEDDSDRVDPAKSTKFRKLRDLLCLVLSGSLRES